MFGSPAPKFDIYYTAVDKQTGQAAAIGMSAPAVLADASEKTGLPKGCFELRGCCCAVSDPVWAVAASDLHQITREDYEALRR